MPPSMIDSTGIVYSGRPSVDLLSISQQTQCYGCTVSAITLYLNAVMAKVNGVKPPCFLK